MQKTSFFAAGVIIVVAIVLLAALAFSGPSDVGWETDASGVAARGTEQTNLPGSNQAIRGGTVTQTQTQTQTQTTVSSARVEAHLGSSVSALGLTLMPVAVEEESRCAQGVQCIQAGTVRVRVQLTGAAVSEQVFTLGQSASVGTHAVSLVSVTPYPQAGSAIDPASYRFVFSVTRN